MMELLYSGIQEGITVVLHDGSPNYTDELQRYPVMLTPHIHKASILKSQRAYAVTTIVASGDFIYYRRKENTA